MTHGGPPRTDGSHSSQARHSPEWSFENAESFEEVVMHSAEELGRAAATGAAGMPVFVFAALLAILTGCGGAAHDYWDRDPAWSWAE
jgi:hypothetical protein